MQKQKHMEINLQDIIINFVDYLLPELTPYETTMYLLLLRKSVLDNKNEVRIGKRTLSSIYGKGSRGDKTNYEHISKLLKGLEAKECIKIGDTTRDGTLYKILLPIEIPIVKEKLNKTVILDEVEDYFTKSENRKIIFERDDWTCFYCGDKVTIDNATLDHYQPQHMGVNHSKENLKTCCLICNSIKSGKTYEEAAPLLLKSIQEKRMKNK